MVRVFGFLLAVATMVSGANAALLAKFDFTNGSGGSTALGGGSSPFTNNTSSDAETVQGGLTEPATFYATTGAANQANGINPSTGLFTSRVVVNSGSGINLGSFTLNLIDDLNVAGGGRVDLTGVKIRFRSSTATNVTSMSYSLDLNGTQVATRTNASPGSFDDTLVSFTSGYQFSDNDGGGMLFTLNAGRAGTATGARMIVDYIEIYGTVVPEPASMAIFGLMGAGFAVRRIRRKA